MMVRVRNLLIELSRHFINACLDDGLFLPLDSRKRTILCLFWAIRAEMIKEELSEKKLIRFSEIFVEVTNYDLESVPKDKWKQDYTSFSRQILKLLNELNH